MMSDIPDSDHSEPLSLIEIDSFRDSEERSRDGKSGKITYRLEYDQKKGNKITKGKITEIGTLTNSKHIDLQPLANRGYTHYGIFRLEDRSTTTIVQDENGSTYKVFSFSKNNVKVSHSVLITMSSDK